MDSIISKLLKEALQKLLPATSQQLVKTMPVELKEIFFKQWHAKQNPNWHPEGNTLKHILVVLKRAYTQFSSNPNMVIAALFHDLGKFDTYEISPKTGQPTAHGHEKKSLEYVDQFSDWINSFKDVDINIVRYVIENHMRVKPEVWDIMKKSKKDRITNNPGYSHLQDFKTIDRGGTD